MILGASLGLAASAGMAASDAAEKKPVRTAKPEKLVLFGDDTWIHTAADTSSARARVTGPDASAGTRHAARLVADLLGDWVEIEPLDDPDAVRHCYEVVQGLASLALRLHVRRTDLLPVTTREMKVRHPDGTGFTLSAGVAVTPPATPGAPHLALPDDVEIGFKPAPGVVGNSYKPTRHFDLPDGEPYMPSPDSKLGGVPIGESLRGRVPLTLASAKDRGTHRLLELRGRCVSVSVLEPIETLGHGFGTGAVGMGTTHSSHGAMLEAGTPLFWPDGRSAGTVRHGVILATDPVSFRGKPPPDGRDCHHVDLARGVPIVPDPSVKVSAPPPPPPERVLRFCFDRASVVTWGGTGF